MMSITLASLALVLLVVLSKAPASQAKARVTGSGHYGNSVPVPACSGAKNKSRLQVRLKVLDGQIRIDQNLSRNGFEPSDLFKCRAQLEVHQDKRLKIENKLLSDLNNAMAQMPRFYLKFVTDIQKEALFSSLPVEERDELIPFLNQSQKKKLFLYLPEDEQLKLVTDLSLKQKKEFFAYLPEKEREKVLAASGDAEKATLLEKKKVTPPLTAPLANESKRVALANYPIDKKAKDAGSWKGFVEAYDSWPGPQPMVVSLNSFLTTYMTNQVLVDTAILGFDAENPTQDAVNGGFSLQVTDPIGDLNNDDDFEILVPEEIRDIVDARYITPSKEKIISLLKPLQGELWERQRIASYINDYFIRDRTGYERDDVGGNALSISPPSDEKKCLIVPPVPHIERVQFIGEFDAKDIDSALRQLLTDDQLRLYRDNAKQFVTECKDEKPPENQPGAEPANVVKIKCKQISFRDLIENNSSLPYLNLQNWVSQQADLAQAGFGSGLKPFDPNPPKPPPAETETSPATEGEDTTSAADNPAPCEKPVPLFVQIRIAKGDASEDSIVEKPAASPTPTPPEPLETEPTATPSPESTATPVATPTPSPTPSAVKESDKQAGIEKPKRNRIGAEFVYRPDQGLHVNGQYAHFRPGKDDFSVLFGGDGGLVVSGDYEGADLFRGKLRQPYPFQIRSYSDSIASRIFNKVKLDERRTGAGFIVSTQLKTNPTLLSLSFEARHETVALADNKVLSKQNVSSLSFGGTYSSVSRGVRFRRVWQFEPSVRLGLGISQPSFAVWHLNGRLHQYLPGQFDLIFDGRMDLATSRTPLFEQPSFGSSETVRGFRADDAIGRRQWSLKNELNLPVPGTTPDSKGLMKALREKVKLAAFVDVGGIYKTTGSKSGTRFGPGGGIRFTYQGAELQLDWAYGLGDSAFGRSRGRFYFSVSREIRRLIRQ